MASSEKLVEVYKAAFHKLVSTIGTTPANRDFAATVALTLNNIIGELDPLAADWAETVIPLAYLRGMRTVAAGEIVGVHTQSVEALVRNARMDLLEANQVVARRVEGALRDLQLEVATGKQASAGSWHEAARTFKSRMATEGIMPPGTMRLDAYAELVARSVPREATNVGTINRATETGYDLVQFSTHANPCGTCAMYEGRVYSLSRNNRDYPYLYDTAFSEGYSLIHPNCRHVLFPIDNGRAEQFREASNAPFEDTRTDKQRRAYAEGQAKKRRARAARNQWENMRAALGSDVPPLLTFSRMRNSQSEGYKELQRRYRDVTSG